MIMGIGITGKSDLPGNPVITVEYHQCDKCDIEFKLYYRHKTDMEEALVEVARKMANNGKEDLCFNCSNPTPAEQLIMPFALT